MQPPRTYGSGGAFFRDLMRIIEDEAVIINHYYITILSFIVGFVKADFLRKCPNILIVDGEFV